MKKIIKFLKKHSDPVNVHYLRKWLVIGGLVGIVAGVGSIVFFSFIKLASKLFLELGVGFSAPVPVGEGETIVGVISRRWMIPVVTTIGGLLCGLLVYKLAPEAEGHGTDAAIDAFHHKEGLVRARIPVVKMIASAITIGSGGSAGREGPIAQISAGFGSLLGRLFKLTVKERRIAVAAGIGAGIGAIFKAPLGGAILSTEILYLEGFEIAALIPSFIASIIGYTIYASWAGFTPIFGAHYNIAFHDPYSLIYYAGLGLLCGIIGKLYPRTFYKLRDYFKSLRIPNYFKPALGGLFLGIMGLFLPQVLGMGYGWLQIVMKPQHIIPISLMIILVFAKIAATSFSISSGGSGGVFAPGLFIGGMLGAIVWSALYGNIAHVPVTPEPFVVVGMMALFGGVARAPLAVMFMVGEMAGSYTILAPAMIAVGIAYVIVGKDTIYESQVESPALSPAHRYEYLFPLLTHLKVRDAMRCEVDPANPYDSLKEVEKRLLSEGIKSVPVVEPKSKKLIGMISYEDILRSPTRNGAPVSKFMSTNVITASPDDSLDRVLELLSVHDVGSLPVMRNPENGRRLIGVINRQDVIRLYKNTEKKLLNKNKISQKMD
ncbi:MAG: chloride channel protein [Candidatus Aminicenantes bacterium]|nr:chloride channel protein [Candidatus Aminicenantes bacterium]